MAAAFIVVGERFDELTRAVAQQRFDRLRDAFVQGLAFTAEQPVVRDLLSQRVLEDVFEFGVSRLLADEISGGKRGKASVELGRARS